MIRVSVLYPNTEGAKFDMAYYRDAHLPMVKERLGPACRSMAVDEGVAGAAPGSPPTYLAMCHLCFDTVEAFQEAFGPHADSIMADIANYTDTEPVIQISAVVI